MARFAHLSRLPLCVVSGVVGFLCLACEPSEDELRLVGIVERTAVELVAPVAETIVEVTVVRGEPVEAGRVLARMDATLAEVEVARAEANLASARSAHRIAQLELTRLERLRTKRVASAQDLERAELGHDEAEARLRAAKAVLSAARKHVSDLELRSPVPGVVDQLPFEAGERVPAGSILAVVLSDAAPWVRVWVPETRVAELAPGSPAEIRIDGIAEPLHGRVLDVAREPAFTPHYALTERDRVFLVYETRIGIEDAPNPIRPGMPAEVRFPELGAGRTRTP